MSDELYGDEGGYDWTPERHERDLEEEDADRERRDERRSRFRWDDGVDVRKSTPAGDSEEREEEEA